jgi:predicted 2-oxoglutarate/Fe(II)-dependent dioxygenase YbiX
MSTFDEEIAAFSAIKLPSGCSGLGFASDECLAVVVDDALTEEECKGLIDRGAPQFQYIREARHEVDGKAYYVKIQNPKKYKLAVFEDGELTRCLWERIRERISPAVDLFAARSRCGEPLGLNPRLRVLHYSGEDQFEAHYDRIVPDEESGQQSMITVLVYLNNGGGDEFSGGETIFLDSADPSQGPVPVEPKVGRAVIFEHVLYHTGSPLAAMETGSKYVMRTDIMFETRDEVRGDMSRTTDDTAAQSQTQSQKPPWTASSKKKVVIDDVSMEALLNVLQLGYLRDNLEMCGLLGSLKAFRFPGECATHEMLIDLEVGEAEAKVIIGAAFADDPLQHAELVAAERSAQT